MQQSRLFIAILFVTATLIIMGCRVENASNEQRDPTPADRIISIDFDGLTPTTDLGFIPTQEVSEDTTVVAQEVSPTATETAALPTMTLSPTPTFTQDFRLGQGGNFATFTSEPTQVAFEPASNTATPTASPTATNTPTDTPTNTPTDTPTATPTDTPTHTATASATASPTLTPSLSPTATEMPITPTMTPFQPDAIGGGPNNVPTEVSQDATLNPQQLTATAFILQVTQNAAGTAGVTIPTSETDTSTITETTPVPNQGVTDTTGTTTENTGQQAGATSYPDCQEFIDPGETLSQIASTYNIDEDDLANYNQLTNKDYIKAGDYLNIPGCGRNPTPTPTLSPEDTGSTTGPAIDPDNSAGPVSYIVQAGDNIYNLSVRFGVTMSELWNANRSSVPDINVLSEGLQLTIPQRSQPVGTSTETPAPTG